MAPDFDSKRWALKRDYKPVGSQGKTKDQGAPGLCVLLLINQEEVLKVSVADLDWCHAQFIGGVDQQPDHFMAGYAKMYQHRFFAHADPMV